MIQRNSDSVLKKLAQQFKALAVIGPRQSGKTTLVKYTFPDKVYVSLENPDIRSFALSDPKGFLHQYPQGAILDEVQRLPELFSYLQQILDENETKGLFILTGSNNFLLQENISQSLAGRIAYLTLLPFSHSEISGLSVNSINEILFKGLYPPLYNQNIDIDIWYQNYIRTYIERDVRQLKNINNLNTFERFVRLCAGRTGQILNMSSLAIETGVDHKTIQSWISVLESSFIIYRLQPHYKNFNKRLVKMPKLYFYDTGLASHLLNIQTVEQMSIHPFRGALFENFIINELIKMRFNEAKKHHLYYWRDNTGHEIDIISENANQLIPIEIKSGQTITSDYFKGLDFWNKIANQKGGYVIYSGDQIQNRSNGVSVIPWNQINENLSLNGK